MQLPTIDGADWDADGSFAVRVNGEIITVPPLSPSSVFG
jgi:hypothetical protein